MIEKIKRNLQNFFNKNKKKTTLSNEFSTNKPAVDLLKERRKRLLKLQAMLNYKESVNIDRNKSKIKKEYSKQEIEKDHFER